MTNEPREVGTRIRFVPDEEVHKMLFELMDPFLTERLMKARQPLGFFSMKAYVSDAPSTDITLRRFIKNVDNRALPYGGMTFSTWGEPSDEDRPKYGLSINVAVDTQDVNDVAWGAEKLGFCDESKIIMARLALPHYNLKDGRINHAKTLELRDYVASGQEEVVAEILQIDLT